MIIIDSHCHLDSKELISDLDNIIANAAAHNIKYMQTICTKISEFNIIHQIAVKYSNIFCSIGTHPNYVATEKFHDALDIIKYTKLDKVIGIGETGLDYYYDYAPKDLQKKNFNEHIKASQETDLPVIIHTREAANDTISLLKENLEIKPFPALIHCFTEDKNFAKQVLDLGLYISISGIVTFKNAEKIRTALSYIPIDRLIVETDSPYLAPIPYRGKINQPAYTKVTLEFIADFLKINIEKLADKTTNNFFTLFKKANV
jgi:TatD DNase family protein